MAPDHTARTLRRRGTIALLLGLLAVVALFSALFSGSPATASPQTQSAPPAPVDSVTVTRTSGALTASWNAPSGATQYHITYSSDGGHSWTSGSRSNTTTNTTITGVDDAKAYIVAVRAGNAWGWSGWTNSASSAAIVTPSAVSAVYIERGDGSIFATWPSATYATKYEINYKATDSQSWSTASNNHAWSFIIISGTDNAKTYVVRVRAGNANGWSGWTSSAQIPPAQPIIIDPLPPSIPQVALTASGVTNSGATLTISGDHTGAWWYQRGLPSGDDTCHSAGSNATATLSGLTSSTYHMYEAYTWSGCSGAHLVATARFTTAYAPTPGSRDSSKDFGTLATANTNPDGLWSDGTTMWVSDLVDKKVYAYTLATKARDAGKDISFSGNNSVSSMTADGTTMWSADLDNDKLFAYSISGRSRATSKDITLHTDNSHPYALWANSATIWVGDQVDKKIYAYAIATGTRDTSKEFNLGLGSGNSDVFGLWSDGATMWVADNADNKLYAYKLSDGSRDSAKDYTLNSANADPYGIWSNGTTMWVADDGDDKLYAYHSMSPGAKLTTLAVAPTTATLFLGAYAGSWYYQANTGPDSTCSSTAQTGNTLSLSGLSGGATYTYRAYDQSGCNSADQIASVTFTTSVSVGNLSETKASTASVGQVLTSNIKIAGGFTTGSSSNGYTLEKVAAKFDAKVGSPSGFTAAIHAASSGSPAATATCALSGSAPDTAGEYAYTPSATCDLSASTTYFLVLSASGTSGGQHYYKWQVTDSNDQTNTPSDAGWTIADSAKSKVGSSDWGNITSAQAAMLKLTAAAKATLSSSGVGTTGATLTIANHTGDWYYKADVAPDNTCQGPVSGTSKTLSGLSAGTTYTYTAYSDSACTTANELATASAFTTTIPAPSGLSWTNDFQAGGTRISWDKPAGLTGSVSYELECETSRTGTNWTSCGSVTSSAARPSHVVSGFSNLKFRVRAKVGSATSPWAVITT